MWFSSPFKINMSTETGFRYIDREKSWLAFIGMASFYVFSIHIPSAENLEGMSPSQVLDILLVRSKVNGYRFQLFRRWNTSRCDL